jgi:hypothetical protein
VGIKQKTEEEQEKDIFDKYSQLREEPSSDRRQVYFGQLCDSVYRWCENHLFSETGEMGVEIVEALEQIVKEGNNTPKEKASFFNYLVTSLYKARAESYRNKKDIIKLPRIIYDMEKVIWSQQSNAGRTLSDEEKIMLISKWFNKSVEKAKIYLKAINTRNVSDLAFYAEGKEKNILDSEDLELPYSPSPYEKPEDTIFSEFKASVIREAVESVLLDMQERTRERHRALFTAFCLDNIKDFEELTPVLDREILDDFLKHGKKYTQYEIYLKYKPEVTKESAETRASEMLAAFLNALNGKLKKKNPEIFS